MKQTIFSICMYLGTFLYSQMPVSQLMVLEFTSDSISALKKSEMYKGIADQAYVNQPYFINNNTLMFTADEDKDGFTDLHYLDLASKSFYKITETKGISEFSPRLNYDKSKILTTRIELDGKTQTIWQYPRDRSSSGQVYDKALINPGYYMVVNQDELIYFKVVGGNSLVHHNSKTQKSTTIADTIGRCFLKTKAGHMLYTKVAKQGYDLYKYDLATRRSQLISNLPNQDFALDAYDNIITSKETMLLKFTQPTYAKPIQFLDLSNNNIKSISRMDAKENKLAIIIHQ